jgi:hypothetical protein
MLPKTLTELYPMLPTLPLVEVEAWGEALKEEWEEAAEGDGGRFLTANVLHAS